LDVSQNVLEKKSVEYLVAALGASTTAGDEPGLVSLRMDDCSLRPAALETLCTISFFSFLSIDLILIFCARSGSSHVILEEHFVEA